MLNLLIKDCAEKFNTFWNLWNQTDGSCHPDRGVSIWIWYSKDWFLVEYSFKMLWMTRCCNLPLCPAGQLTFPFAHISLQGKDSFIGLEELKKNHVCMKKRTWKVQQYVEYKISVLCVLSDFSWGCLYGFLCVSAHVCSDCLHLHVCDPNHCSVSHALVCPACLLCADIWCRGRLSAP